MKIFITGTTGYIGHAIAMEAARRNLHVVALVRNSQSVHKPVHRNIHYAVGDILNYDSVRRSMKGCSHVIHTAGLSRLYDRHPEKFYSVNIDGTRNVLDAAVEHQVKSLVFTSSCAVLGPSYKYPVKEDDPRITTFENHYEISKYAAEQLVIQYTRNGLHATIAAPSRVYGPGPFTEGNPLTSFISQTIRRGFAFIPAAGDVIGNYVHIDDVVRAHLLALEKGRSGEKYNCGGVNATYREFFTTLQQVAPTTIRYIRVGRRLLQVSSIISMAAAFVLQKQTQLSPKVVARLFQNRAVDSSKAEMELGYTITSLADGLTRTIGDSIKSNEQRSAIHAHNRRGEWPRQVAER